MREILFRGKRVDNGKWVHGTLNNVLDEVPRIQYAVIEHGMMFLTDFDVIPETVGQYTGLKDKNGTKIFEFDICKAYIHISKVGKKQLTGAICFEEGAFKFKCKRYIFNIYDLSASIEVIGNAFDSPELLEEDKT